MKVKLIIISIILLLVMVFASGCIFLEMMSTITSPSLEVDRSGDGVVNYWAVIVGIEDYQFITDLSYTIDDAVDMKDVLVSYSNWNDSNSNIQLLTDVDASKENIELFVKTMVTSADADDVCLFFFSGHGSNIPDEEGGDEVDRYDEVICPWDTTEELGNVISDDELGTWLSDCPGNIVVILDTCMSGGFATKGAEGTIKTVPNPQVPKDAIAKKHFGEGLVEHLKQRPISRDLNQAKYVVLMACEEDKSAYESRRLKNGVFTYYVVEGLWGPADEINISDDKISAEEAFYYAEPLVLKYRPTNQDPQICDDYTGDLHLVIASTPDTGTIVGEVTDATDLEAIPGATVVVKGPNLLATTDASGYYEITNVPVGICTVTASATGYNEESLPVEVLQGQTTVVDFVLIPTSIVPTLYVNVATDEENYVLRETVYITVTVTENNESKPPVESAIVQTEITTASGHKYTKDGITDSNGKVTFKFKIKKPDGKGEYIVIAEASKSGYDSGTGDNKFNVN